MGSSCSEEQATVVVKLVNPDGRIWIIPDGDKAGEHFAASALLAISPLCFVKQLKLNDGKQPTDYPGGFFHKAFA